MPKSILSKSTNTGLSKYFKYKYKIHRVSKNCAKLFLSKLRQIYTNFDNFWHKDGKEAKIMRDALISTSFISHHHTTVLNADVPNC